MSNYKNNNIILNNDSQNQYQNIIEEIYRSNPRNYSETKSIYEFFILSLLKNTNIKKEEAISLIFNFNKNNFIKIFINNILLLNWIKDIKNNFNIIQNLIEISNINDEIKIIIYKIISIGLYTNNIEIITITDSIIEKLTKKIQIDLDWFVNEGYIIYIKNINEFSLIRVSLIKSLIEITKNNEDIFFKMIKNDFINYKSKEEIILFMENILSIKENQFEINLFKKKFFIALQEIYFDYNLSLNQKDIPTILNLLTYGWNNNPYIFIDENNKNNNNNGDSKLKNILLIIFQENIFNKYGINCICSIINLFLLLAKFGKIKSEDGPLIYKTLVYQFINQFENELKKELFLNNFVNFFFINLKFPIDLFLSPYLEKLYKTKILSLIDFNFISIIISHPRFTCENAYEIICLLLDFSFNDKIYTKCITMIINLIFSIDLLLKNEIIYEKSTKKFTSYIINVLNIYKDNINKENNINNNYNNLLEISYCIIIKKIFDINNNVKEILISSIEEYRKFNNKNSNELLKLLWPYDIYDDILLKIEEKYYNEINFEKKNKDLILSNINKDNIKNKNCLLFQKAKKINIIDKDNKTKKSFQDINKIMKNKVESDIKKINDNQKKHILLENKKENLLKTKEMTIKERLLKLFFKRSLFLGISKNNKQRPHSYNIGKRLGYLLEEGEGEMIYPYANFINKKKNPKMKLNDLLIFNKYKFNINLYEEEKREIKGIEALNQQYKNQIKYLFDKIVDNFENISKSSFIKFLREKNITKNELTLDELTFCTKITFPDNNLIYFNQNEFLQLLMTISYYIMNKKNNMYTLYESYYHFLKIILEKEKDKDQWKNIKYSKVRQFLKNNLDKNNGKIKVLLPPGFKIVERTNVYYIKQFPKYLTNKFKESTIICYKILDEILLKNLKCKHGILENYIKIDKIYDIEIEPNNIKGWSQDLMIAYSSLPKEYNIIGKEVASLLEEGLRKISLGKSLELEKKEIIKKEKIINKTNNKKNNKSKEIKEKIENSNKIKELKKDLEKSKEKERNEKKEINNLKSLKEDNIEENIENEKNKKNHKLFLKINKIENKKLNNNISVLKFKSDEKSIKTKEKIDKKENIINNIHNIKEKMKRRIFLTEQNKKVKEELDLIKKKRKLKELKKRNLSENLPKINANYFIENKEYIELDKKLILNIKNIIDNNSNINCYINKYNDHLKLIFDIYHKIGLNSITSINFIIEDSLCYNEYKEFLINFGILNVFISKEQMNFIFKRLSRQNLNNKNNKNNDNIILNNIDKVKIQQKSYLTFDDFKLSLILILILSNMENDNIQIMKSDYDSLNEKIVELLFEYLELEIPFFRRDIEDMINQRRNMNSKEFKEWKKKKKNNLLNIFNNLFINKDDYSTLLKKIKTNFDILPTFSDIKITKVFSEKKIKKENKKKNLKNSNDIPLKKLKIKKNFNKISLNAKKYSISLDKKNKSEKNIYNKSNSKIKNLKEKKIKKIENEDDMKSIDFSLSYTISTIRDKEIGSIETNINTVTNLINKSEHIKEKKKENNINKKLSKNNFE